MAVGMQILGPDGSPLKPTSSLGYVGSVLAPPDGGGHYTYAGITGTIAAALAANSSIFAMRLSPSAGSIKAYIGKLRITFTTIVAFTTAIAAARRLALFRGSGAAASGGTGVAINTVVSKASSMAASQFDLASGGDIRIATTGALTVTGITYETEPLEVMPLTHVGAAGAFYERVFEFTPFSGSFIELTAGQLLAVRNPAAMDAAGTWQATVDVEWYEGTSYIKG